MQFNQVNDNQIQIIVTKNDLGEKNIRALFQDIIKQAQQLFGFEIVNDTSLMVETYPLSEESIIVMITKVNANDIDIERLFTMSQQVYDDDPALTFMFADLEDVISLAKSIKDNVETDTTLFKYDNKYFLFIEDADAIVEESRGHFLEFGELVFFTKAYLAEHGTVLLEHDALQNLRYL